jgi:hypothetical protein
MALGGETAEGNRRAMRNQSGRRVKANHFAGHEIPPLPNSQSPSEPAYRHNLYQLQPEINMMKAQEFFQWRSSASGVRGPHAVLPGRRSSMTILSFPDFAIHHGFP